MSILVMSFLNLLTSNHWKQCKNCWHKPCEITSYSLPYTSVCRKYVAVCCGRVPGSLKFFLPFICLSYLTVVSQPPETCVPMPFGSFFGTTDEVSFLYVHRKKKKTRGERMAVQRCSTAACLWNFIVKAEEQRFACSCFPADLKQSLRHNEEQAWEPAPMHRLRQPELGGSSTILLK